MKNKQQIKPNENMQNVKEWKNETRCIRVFNDGDDDHKTIIGISIKTRDKLSV